MEPILSVVILNWNTSSLLRNCINSIEEYTRDLNYEVIVVDNGSSDGSQEMIRREFQNINLIETGKNLGFPKGNNIGIRASKGNFILILNSDILLESNTFPPWIEFLKNTEDAAGAICRIEGSDGKRQVNLLRFPTVLSEWLFFSVAMLSPYPLMIPKSKFMLHLDYSKVGVADTIAGSAMMLKREVIEQAGAFDEKIFLFHEDSELCNRITRITGKRFYYFPDSKIIHLGSGSYTPGSYWQTKHSFRSACYYFYKVHGMKTAQLFKTATRFSWVLSLFLLGTINFLTLGRISKIKRKFGIYRQLMGMTANCLSGTT